MNKKLFIFNDEIWTIEKVIEALREHITLGDILCMEVDTMRFGKLCHSVSRNQFLSNFFELFKELAGKSPGSIFRFSIYLSNST